MRLQGLEQHQQRTVGLDTVPKYRGPGTTIEEH